MDPLSSHVRVKKDMIETRFYRFLQLLAEEYQYTRRIWDRIVLPVQISSLCRPCLWKVLWNLLNKIHFQGMFTGDITQTFYSTLAATITSMLIFSYMQRCRFLKVNSMDQKVMVIVSTNKSEMLQN